MNLNKVVLIGRLAADPEGRTTTSGQEVVNLRLVTNRVWTDPNGQKQEQPEFHSVVLWGRLAQIANQYLKKGGLAMIEGRLQTRSWTGNDGQKRYRTEVVAENIQLGPRPASSTSSSAINSPVEPYRENFSNRPSGFNQKFTSTTALPKKEEEIPVISEDEPVQSVQDEPAIISDNELEESTIELKDIPF